GAGRFSDVRQTSLVALPPARVLLSRSPGSLLAGCHIRARKPDLYLCATVVAADQWRSSTPSGQPPCPSDLHAAGKAACRVFGAFPGLVRLSTPRAGGHAASPQRAAVVWVSALVTASATTRVATLDAP